MEGQVATGAEVAQATTQPEGPPTTQPSEEYKGFQRKISALEVENERLKRQVGDGSRLGDTSSPAVQFQPQQQPQVQLNATQQLAAQNAYHQTVAYYKSQGVDDAAAHAYGQAAYANVLYQYSQGELQNLQTQRYLEQAEQEAREAARRVTNEMRSFATMLNVAPDSPVLDYGDESGDPADRWRTFRESVTRAQAVSPPAPPAEPPPPPDRSAERVDTTGGSRPPSDNAQILKERALAADAAFRGGDQTHNAAQIRAMFKEAEAAGADFNT